MGLLDNGPHTVQVYLEETTTDARGNPVRQPKASGPVTVAGCWMQPVESGRDGGSARDLDQGQRVSVTYRLIARNAPVGFWAAVVWQGRRFAPVGGPQVRDFSTVTGHVSVVLREER
jgi:hypothetical protein